ncbi:MAG: hypothetical protein AAGI13_15170, partial [Pseudomonadota bacterium]
MDGSSHQAGQHAGQISDQSPYGTDPTGAVLNGIYRVEERLAQGGMGEVYTGRVIETGDRVAIKMLLPQHASDALMIG